MDEFVKSNKVFAMDLMIDSNEWTPGNIFWFGQTFGEYMYDDGRTQVWIKDYIPERDMINGYVVVRVCCDVETSRTMVKLLDNLMLHFDSMRISNIEVYR